MVEEAEATEEAEVMAEATAMVEETVSETVGVPLVGVLGAASVATAIEERT